MNISKYTFISLIIAGILMVIPFFWFVSGEMDLGGDSNRLYFYDPLSYLRHHSPYNIVPTGIGGEAVSYYALPYISLLVLLRYIVSATFAISLINGIKLSFGFFFCYLLIKELLNIKASQNKNYIIEISAILSALFYALSPILVNSGWEKAIFSHMQIFLNPLFFYLILKYFLKNSKKYLVGLLLLSFVFSMAFSYAAAPPFFAFYPMSLAFIILYIKYIRNIKISIKGIIFGCVLFFLLQGFHIIPHLLSIFSLGSDVGASVFSDQAKFSRGLDYFTAIAPTIKVSIGFLALPQRIEGGIVSLLHFLFPLIILLGFYYNRSKTLLLSGIAFLIVLFLSTANITDTGFFVYKSLFYIPGFKMFRNFFAQWSFAFIFFYALLFSQSLAVVLSKIKTKYRILLGIFIISLLLFDSWKLLNNGMNSFHYQSKQIKSVFEMDPEYEKVLRFIHDSPIDGKILTLPLAGPGYQVISGKNGVGAYVGPSTFSYLAGKNDYTGYEGLQPFGEFFLQTTTDKKYLSIGKLFSYLNIQYVFYNSDPKIYDDNFPSYPYDYSREFLPKTQNGYKNFIQNMPLDFENKIDFGKKFHFYPVREDVFLPHIYTTNTIVHITQSLTLPLLSEVNTYPLRSAFLDVENAKETDKNIILESQNNNSIYLINNNSHLHQHRPFISISLESPYYPFILPREKLTLWRNSKNPEFYLDLSLLNSAKRIAEIEEFGNNMPIGDTNWREPYIWEFYNWYRYNSWSLSMLRYKLGMEKIIDWVNARPVSKIRRDVYKIKINEQLNQQKVKLIKSILRSNKKKEDNPFLYKLINKTFDAIYKRLDLDYYDTSRFVYTLYKPDRLTGEHEVYIEDGKYIKDLSNTNIQIEGQKVKSIAKDVKQNLLRFGNINLSGNENIDIILSAPSENQIKNLDWETTGKLTAFGNTAELAINNVIIDGTGGMIKEIPGWTSENQYVITFDYMTFGDDFLFKIFDNQIKEEELTRLTGGVYLEKNLNSKTWKKTQSIITAHTGSVAGFLQIVANSNKKDMRLQIRNLTVVEMHYPKIILKKSSSKNQNQEGALPKITFTKINLTKYKIDISNAIAPYALVFLESYNPNWRIYSDSEGQGISSFVFRTIGSISKSILSVFIRDKQNTQVVQSYFNGDIHEGRHGQIFLDLATFESWGKKSIAEKSHFNANGYGNSWSITPADLQGKTSYTLILEMSTQRYFYLFFAISVATVVMLCIYFILIIFKKNEKIL